MSDIITITGSLGSGKSTVAKIIESKLGFTRYSTGQAQRQIAEKYGITTLELNKRAEIDKTIDEEIDGVFRGLEIKNRPMVIDSRMAWHFISSSFKVKLEIDETEAAKRVFNDDTRKNETRLSLEETLLNLRKRRQSEVERFKKYYRVDIEDAAHFNLVIDTSFLSPEEVADKIITAFNAYKKASSKK